MADMSAVLVYTIVSTKQPPPPMPPDNFGVFEPVFESSTRYLQLMNLSDSNAVWLVYDCCMDRAARKDVFHLLSEQNWRPTLVGAVAALFLPVDERLHAALWSQIDRGSWVIPQLAAVLARVDPDFESQCRRRLEAHCPTRWPETTSAEQDSAAGGVGPATHSAKAATTLAWLAGRISPTPAWLQPVLDSAGHQKLVEEDRERDRAANITERWHDRITAILKEMFFAGKS